MAQRYVLALLLLSVLAACKGAPLAGARVEAEGPPAEPRSETRPQASLGDRTSWLATPVYQDKDLFAAIRKLSADTGTPIPQLTVEQVIGLLPAEMHENYTLIYASKSLQGASAARPKAVLFMRNGTFVAAFNGDPALKGFGGLEFLQYRVDARRYELGFLNFPLKAADVDADKNAFAQQDHTVCLSCHGASEFNGGQVPRWGHYPDWPGIYGGFEDLLIDPENVEPEYIRRKGSCQAPLAFKNIAPAVAQSADFFANKPAWKTHPRYKFLSSGSVPTLASWPFDLEYRGKFVNRPNLRFGSALQRNFIDSVMARLEADAAYYRTFRYMYLYGYAGCDAGTPHARLADLRARAALGRDAASPPPSAAPLTQLFLTLAGVDPAGLSFSPAPMTKAGFGYDEGFMTSDQAIAARLIAGLDAEADPAARFFHFESLQACYPGYGDDYAKAEDQFGVEPRLYTPTFTPDNALSPATAAALASEAEANRAAVCSELAKRLWPE